MTDEPRFTESSGNVFADLGLPDAGTRLAKAELARRISLEIEARRLTQRDPRATQGILTGPALDAPGPAWHGYRHHRHRKSGIRSGAAARGSHRG